MSRLSDYDLYLFGEGNHHRIHDKLGAHLGEFNGEAGCWFAVWAPNARRVSVVGPFNDWDGRRHPLSPRAGSGIWEGFVPGLGEGSAYKYELAAADGRLLLKSDPYGRGMQHRPDNCSVIQRTDRHPWRDGAWLRQRAANDPADQPVVVYELHPGSWARSEGPGGPFPGWRELAERLVPHVAALGYTHLELMAVAEHPLDESWGYQVTGYFAPSARFGPPEDLQAFVDACHAAGLGVIMDWVPAHFPRDDNGLAEFDGTALYEHADPRLGEHRDWGTKIFNYGRHEVRNFLIANALYWIETYHLDGLRVDAVASMLYLDYSRPTGEWLPNRHGGRENLEAIEFLRQCNATLARYHPGVLTIAEESTAFPGVTRPVEQGGLGFSMKWNMGWMNDTLRYFALDPVHRSWEHHLLTFSLVYAFSERFMLPLSHDEVVHGKRSLLGKMPGDAWQRFANLRLLFAWMAAHPGKKLQFMGSELAPEGEWQVGESLDWGLLDDPMRLGCNRCLADLNGLYRSHPALHASDWDPEGFRWLEADNAAESCFAFRRGRPGREPEIICLFNATPVPRVDRLIGVERAGTYVCLHDGDAGCYGGSDHPLAERLQAGGAHGGLPHSIRVTLPPLAALFYLHVGEGA